MKSEKLNKYLELKGFTENDLYDNNAIILDNDGFIGPTDKTKWVNTVVVSDGDKEYTVIDILKKKERQYFNEGVTSAIFVPLFNLCDEFVGMSIRKMGESKHDSWFMPGERKIDLIYNLNNAIIPASNKSSIIITEGVYDTIALKKYGFLNSVSILGTHMSNIQFFQLISVVNNIALCLDNDEAGKKAIRKIYEDHKEDVTFYTVNINKDPDEFLKENGATEFRKRIFKI